MVKIQNLERQESLLCQLLGRKCKTLYRSPLPPEDEIEAFSKYVDDLIDEKARREGKFIAVRLSIIKIMEELNIKPSLEFECKVISGDYDDLKFTDDTMNKLEEFHSVKQALLEETRSKISDLRESLSKLWEMLEENPEVRSRFLEKYPGNSLDTLKALKVEIDRCNEKKKENIKIFIARIREELVRWWDKCRFGPEKRREFLYFESDCYTEDLITFHELEIEKVKTFYENNK